MTAANLSGNARGASSRRPAKPAPPRENDVAQSAREIPYTNDMNYAADVLSDLKDHVIRFIQLDFTYLAAAGAIAVALKFGTDSLFELASHRGSYVFAYLFIAAFDFSVAWTVHYDWLSAKSNFGKRVDGKVIRRLLVAQPALHFLFLSVIAMHILGFAQGYAESKNQILGRVLVQDAVQLYIAAHGKTPISIEEIGANSSDFSEIRRKLNGETFRYERLNPTSYRLTFAGWDKVLDTNDDEQVTEKYRIRESYERIFGH